MKMPFKEAIDKYCQEKIVSVAKKVDQLPEESVEVSEKLQLLFEYIHNTIKRILQIAKNAELNLQYMKEITHDGSEAQLSQGVYELKLGRILKLTDSILQDIIADPFGSFYFSPLVSNYHVKANPIARITTQERIETILKFQKYLLEQIIDGKEQLEKLLSEGLEKVLEEFSFTSEDFTLPEEEVPNFLQDAEGELTYD